MNVEQEKLRDRRAIALMERNHLGGEPLASDYPLVFGEGANGSVEALEYEGDVRSACATLVRDFIVANHRIPVGLIGSVSTDPDWRGQGLATELLHRAESHLKAKGCLFSLLWANDAEFYFRRGYVQVGEEVDFRIDPHLRPHLPIADPARKATEGDFEAIHSLYVQHAERVDRSREETARSLACPGVSTLVAEGGSDEGLAAYACLGRGADLGHVVHEWGGRPELVLGLVRLHLESELRSGFTDGVYVMTPPSALQMHQMLAELGAQRMNGVLGMARLLDLEGAVRLFQQAAGNPLVAATEGIRSDNPRASIRGDLGVVTMEPQELLETLFAPRGDRSAIVEIEGKIGVELPGLPLFPFAFGLDSI